MERHTGYARLGSQRVAYEVAGDGPIDLVHTPGSWGAFDTDWEDPVAELFLRRLASFTRLIRFDRRGTGASDPLTLDALPPWEAFVEELECVMDSVGSKRAAIMTAYDAGPMGMLFAASKPELTTALILVNTSARFLIADDYPIGVPPEAVEEIGRTITDRWGTEEHVALQVPSRAHDPRFCRWYAKKTRSIAGPAAVSAFFQSTSKGDARVLLPAIHEPTLVLHRVGYHYVPIAMGRYIAEHIEGAKFVELPGSDGPLYWEHADEALEAVEQFLTGIAPPAPATRALATVLYTDIVDSTQMLERMGDTRWRSILDTHDGMAADLVDQLGGRYIKSTGDGVLATFDGPGRGIRFATTFREHLRQLDVRIRAGLHCGEVELRQGDIGGFAAHLAARILHEADPGEILVSRTVKDLVVGSDVQFEDRGQHHMKGIDGDWQLLAVAGA